MATTVLLINAFKTYNPPLSYAPSPPEKKKRGGGGEEKENKQASVEWNDLYDKVG